MAFHEVLLGEVCFLDQLIEKQGRSLLVYGASFPRTYDRSVGTAFVYGWLTVGSTTLTCSRKDIYRQKRFTRIVRRGTNADKNGSSHVLYMRTISWRTLVCVRYRVFMEHKSERTIARRV